MTCAVVFLKYIGCIVYYDLGSRSRIIPIKKIMLGSISDETF
jgi:hypothetical protein